jgi:large subunit ribosomal protein L15
MKFRRKKNARMRGSKTHGWGAMKKHRGAGHRGGRGRSGSGKRGDQKKPSYWKTEKAGKHGFHSRVVHASATNLKDLEQRITRLIAEGKAVKKGDVIEINLNHLGYGKLLGAGKVTRKLAISVDTASAMAQEKVSEAGGTVTLTGKHKNAKAE